MASPLPAPSKERVEREKTVLNAMMHLLSAKVRQKSV